MIPSKTSIKKVLREAVVDPRKPGPLKVTLDVADPNYLARRCIELLHPDTLTPEKLKLVVNYVGHLLHNAERSAS